MTFWVIDKYLTLGDGRPWATHVNVIFEPSNTEISLDVVLTSISGGTA